MKRHLEIVNGLNRALGILIGVIIIAAIVLLYIAHTSTSVDDTAAVPEPAAAPAASEALDPKRLWMEETFSPEDLALWDEFHQLEDQGYKDQEVIDLMVEETGISEALLKDHLQNLQHWIATMDYHYSSKGIKRYILEPAISFHPGTAGSSLQRAQAAADILYNVTDAHFHLCGKLAERMEDAARMLTEEEQGWLKENLPGLIEEIDAVFESGISDIYQDAGAYGRISKAVLVEKAEEDWTAVKDGLMEILSEG